MNQVVMMVPIQSYPGHNERMYYFLGEIKDMPGHGLFIGGSTGKVYGGYHIDNFRELTEDER